MRAIGIGITLRNSDSTPCAGQANEANVPSDLMCSALGYLTQWLRPATRNTAILSLRDPL